MTRCKFTCRYAVAFLTLALSVAASAESARVFEIKPARGYARPPLYVNINPLTATPYNPAQIRHAYGVDLLAANGTGQKIAIVDAYGNKSIQTDLDAFCTRFGLPKSTVTILGNNSGSDTGWALETALDVEWVHAIATNATIILSVAKSASDADLLAAVAAATNAGATVVSMSWGGTEWSGETAYDRYFQTPGVTYVASSGDNGELSSLPQVDWPAVSPYVLGVGGTSLYLDANGNRTSPETAWTSSGGGLSTVYGLPLWQNGWFPQWPAKRGVPDVSLIADPNTGVYVYDAVNGGWFDVGGTSASAPMWAALIALANQQRGAAGTLTSANATLYSLAKVAPTPYSINSTCFFDVASGSNGGDPDDISGPGYDLVTGLGTPVASALVPALAGFKPDFSLSVNPTSQPVAAGGISTNYTVTVTPTNGFTATVTLNASGLPAGSTYSFNPASVSGSGSSILSVTTPGGTVAGVYPFTITGTSGSLGHTASATLVVGPPPAPTPISPQGGGISPTPAFTFTTVAGATGYQIYLYDGTTSTYGSWYTPAQVDPSNTGTGTITLPTPFANGSYYWSVRAQNGAGVGPFGPGLWFSVGAPPPAPPQISPQGGGISPTPAFTFTTVAGATGYQIYLYDGTNSTYGSWYTPAQVDPSNTGTGAITLPTPFANGSYFWSVRAQNGAGVGPFGPGLWFTVGAPPPAPTPISPQGGGISPTPAFTFTTVAGATGYQIYLYDGTNSTYGGWYTTAQVDPSNTGTGTITLPTPFANGSYFWSVRAQNAAGVGPFGPGLWFSVP